MRLQQGQNLIFLISQPRSGSTMTQRILGNHPNIHTVSEPWIMLPPLYPLRFDDIQANYNVQLSKTGWQTFFQQFPNQDEVYYHGLRSMYSYIYEQALKNTGKDYFLDKTPRYYYIMPELLKTFPKSKFLILLRNPLAVLCSIINTWTKNDFYKLKEFQSDLIKAPELLVQGIQELGDSCLVLYYEQLITNPEIEFKKICHSIGVEFFPEIIKYGTKNLTKWRFGDKDLVYQKTEPEPKNIDKWISSLKNPQIWYLANDYLEFLGYDTISQMGYSYIKLRDILNTHQPLEAELSSTKIFVVEWLKRSNGNRKTPQSSSDYSNIARTEERKGRLQEAAAAYRKAIELTPNLGWFYNSLGRILFKLQNWEKAVLNYRKAVELNPNSAWFHYSLATALIKQENIHEATTHYQKAIELQPNKKIIQKKLKQLEQTLNNSNPSKLFHFRP